MDERTKKALIKERMRILLDTRAEFTSKIRHCIAEDVSKLYQELDDIIDRILSEEAKVLTSKEARTISKKGSRIKYGKEKRSYRSKNKN